MYEPRIKKLNERRGAKSGIYGMSKLNSGQGTHTMIRRISLKDTTLNRLQHLHMKSYRPALLAT